MAKARLRRGIERVKLANRIEALKMQEDDDENTDMPSDATAAADQSHRSFYGRSHNPHGSASSSTTSQASAGEKRTLSKAVKGAIFREVVLAKVREMKQQEQALKVTEDAEKEAKRKSFSG